VAVQPQLQLPRQQLLLKLNHQQPPNPQQNSCVPWKTAYPHSEKPPFRQRLHLLLLLPLLLPMLPMPLLLLPPLLTERLGLLS
jgi:hypothetical protein